jgi:hypothetical protein
MRRSYIQWRRGVATG